ncbi:MAG: hypothetical protein V4489_03185 [Chlamydiota bacterium]
MENDTLLHVINRLTNAQIHTSPYPYFYIDNIFPDDFYQELLANLPDTSSYQGLSQTGKVDQRTYLDRFVLPLEEDQLNQLSFSQFLFWSNFNIAIKSDEWCSALLKKFDCHIKERFGIYYEKVKFSSTAELVRDRTNYSIGPHTDHPVRVLTLLFYFPSSNDQSHLGTSIYEPLDPTFECEGFTHHPFNGFKNLYTAPFSPNSVFGFVKSNSSFHGREPILDKGIERNLMNYYLQWNHK